MADSKFAYINYQHTWCKRSMAIFLGF